ncbi:MAG: CvpA family protein [Synergistaceae bacterium]|nr:CvpA family protein [Synergistaceae bacterium]
MNIADIALMIIGAFLMIRGLFRGASGEIFSLLSVVGGFFCATKFYAPAARILSESLGLNRLVATGLSMLVIFLAVNMICALADKIIKKVLNMTNLSLADKIGGAFVGLLKLYFVTLFVLVAGMIISPVTGDAWARDSKVLTVTARTLPVVRPLLNALGLLPDLSELKDEARSYVIRQAAGSLFGPENDFGARMLASADISSSDIVGLISVVSADILSMDVTGLNNLPFQDDPQLPDALPENSSKKQVLDFFLGWGD